MSSLSLQASPGSRPLLSRLQGGGAAGRTEQGRSSGEESKGEGIKGGGGDMWKREEGKFQGR